MLLVVAGFMGRALLRVQRIDPGIRPARVLTYGILLPDAKYRDRASRIAFFDEHLARLRALPEVESASASTVLPFSGQHVGNFFEPETGLPGGADVQPPVVLTRMSFPGYFETIGIDLMAGRSFGNQDRTGVVIVNETLARLFWPDQNAVGKRLRSAGGRGAWLEVIGVARDVRHYGLEGETRPGVYVPFYAAPQSSVGIVVRTKGDPARLGPTVRSLLQAQDPLLPVAGLATMETQIRNTMFLRRLYSGMTMAFALVALAMAMTGLYGLVGYIVSQRMREFGIRLALGAQARDLLRLVMREGAVLATCGVAIGLIGGIVGGLGLSRLLRGVSPIDPIVLLGTIAFLVATVIVACLAPARRAMRVDITDVLRAE